MYGFVDYYNGEIPLKNMYLWLGENEQEIMIFFDHS
jgi:hypothetical protein